MKRNNKMMMTQRMMRKNQRRMKKMVVIGRVARMRFVKMLMNTSVIACTHFSS